MRNDVVTTKASLASKALAHWRSIPNTNLWDIVQPVRVINRSRCNKYWQYRQVYNDSDPGSVLSLQQCFKYSEYTVDANRSTQSLNRILSITLVKSASLTTMAALGDRQKEAD
jgi:hypothetical protein